MLVLAMQVSKAQVYDIYIPDGVVLTDNQWHTDGYCIVQANNNTYLVITPNAYDYHRLQPFDVIAFGTRTRDVILSFKPCFYSNTLGWFVEGRRASYFVYPYGGYTILSFRPVYYDYYYRFSLLRHLNMRSYYWYRPHYRPRPLPPPHRPGYHSRPPGYNRPPQNPPRHPGQPSFRPGENRPPQNPPRHPGQPSFRPGENRPPQGHGTQIRPPQRSNGTNHSSGNSGRSPSRRR